METPRAAGGGGWTAATSGPPSDPTQLGQEKGALTRNWTLGHQLLGVAELRDGLTATLRLSFRIPCLSAALLARCEAARLPGAAAGRGRARGRRDPPAGHAPCAGARAGTATVRRRGPAHRRARGGGRLCAGAAPPTATPRPRCPRAAWRPSEFWWRPGWQRPPRSRLAPACGCCPWAGGRPPRAPPSTPPRRARGPGSRW